MPSDKPRLRTPDGRPEMRTPDEMLRDAVTDENFADLPGKGKPLDLTEYFKPSAENRLAGKILRDNKVLPPQLQERKDAEEHLQDAEEELQKATERIAPIREALRPLAQLLISTLADSDDLITTLNLDGLPNEFHPPSEMPAIYSVDPIELAGKVNQLIKRHNALVRNLTYRYFENIKIAHENIEASKKRQLINRTLFPAYAPTARVDIEAKREEIQSRFAQLSELPEDWESSLKSWRRSQKPSLWKRMVHSA